MSLSSGCWAPSNPAWWRKLTDFQRPSLVWWVFAPLFLSVSLCFILLNHIYSVSCKTIGGFFHLLVTWDLGFRTCAANWSQRQFDRWGQQTLSHPRAIYTVVYVCYQITVSMFWAFWNPFSARWFDAGNHLGGGEKKSLAGNWRAGVFRIILAMWLGEQSVHLRTTWQQRGHATKQQVWEKEPQLLHLSAQWSRPRWTLISLTHRGLATGK